MSEWPMVYSGVSLKWANSFFEPSGLHCSLFPRAKEAGDLSSPGNAVQVENRDEATEKVRQLRQPTNLQSLAYRPTRQPRTRPVVLTA
nr:hypothetical protein K4M19_00046 [Agrobacterium fabrum]